MYEVDAFVPIHADSVTGAMTQTGCLVTRAVTERFIIRPDGIIDRAGGCTQSRRFESNLLSFADSLPDFPLPFRWTAQNKGARDVRSVPFDRTTTIHQHNLPFFNFLWLVGAMRISAGLAKQGHVPDLNPAQRRLCVKHHRVDVGRRHPRFQSRIHMSKCRQGHFAGLFHQRDFIL